MADWNSRYLEMARLVQSWSKDPSTKVGAVIFNPSTHAILSVGYNGFPRGVDENSARQEREVKYLFTVHAEKNAIFNAARHGIALSGMGVALDWHPCAECAGAIVQSGISVVVCPYPDLLHPRWGVKMAYANDIFSEAEITTNYFTPTEVRP